VVATGTNLAGATGVTVGGIAATSVSSTPTTVTFTTPIGSLNVAGSGVVYTVQDIVVTTPLGSATLAASFTRTSEMSRIFGSDLAWEGRFAAQNIGLVGGATVSLLPGMTVNGDAMQATANMQVAYSANGQHGGPCGTGDGVNDALIATLTTALAVGERAYIFLGVRHASNTIYTASAGVNSNDNSQGLMFFVGGTQDIGNRLDDSGPGYAIGPLYNTSYRRMEIGFTVGGIASFVVDGVSYNDVAATGAPGLALPILSLFSSIPGLSPGNSAITDIAVVRRIPTAGELTSVRAFNTGAYFAGPGYTGGTYA
jgi:hypothetical protein